MKRASIFNGSEWTTTAESDFTCPKISVVRTASMIAIISDIHGNLAGLEMVLSDINNRNCQSIICLGDLVDGGPENAKVVDRIKGLNIPCVRGNHDACNMANLDEGRQAWLDALHEEIIDGDLCYTHISPRKNRARTVNNAIDAWNVFDETVHRITFVGHTHISTVFCDKSPFATSASEVNVPFNEWLTIDRSRRYIISVGAIGYSRDSRKTIRYGLYKSESNSLLIREIYGPTIL